MLLVRVAAKMHLALGCDVTGLEASHRTDHSVRAGIHGEQYCYAMGDS